MAENYLENATGFQVYDALTGELQGGGTFGPNGVTSYTPTMAAPAASSSNPLSNAQSVINNVYNAAGFSLPSSPSSPTTAAQPASTGSGSAPATASPAASGGNPSPGNPTGSGSGAADSGSGSMLGTLSSYFVRAVVIIVGFIFLAIGLHQLSPSLVPAPSLPPTPKP